MAREWSGLDIPFELNSERWRTDVETASLLRSLFNDDKLETFQAVFLLGKHSGRIVPKDGEEG